MNENDQKLMGLLLLNKGKYKVYVDNDCVSVYDEKGAEVGSFSEFGYHLLNQIFQYMGIDSELV